jgi:hypothetical protein
MQWVFNVGICGWESIFSWSLLLPSAIEVCEFFLPKGLAVFTPETDCDQKVMGLPPRLQYFS